MLGSHLLAIWTRTNRDSSASVNRAGQPFIACSVLLDEEPQTTAHITFDVARHDGGERPVLHLQVTQIEVGSTVALVELGRAPLELLDGDHAARAEAELQRSGRVQHEAVIVERRLAVCQGIHECGDGPVVVPDGVPLILAVGRLDDTHMRADARLVFPGPVQLHATDTQDLQASAAEVPRGLRLVHSAIFPQHGGGRTCEELHVTEVQNLLGLRDTKEVALHDEEAAEYVGDQIPRIHGEDGTRGLALTRVPGLLGDAPQQRTAVMDVHDIHIHAEGQQLAERVWGVSEEVGHMGGIGGAVLGQRDGVGNLGHLNLPACGLGKDRLKTLSQIYETVKWTCKNMLFLAKNNGHFIYALLSVVCYRSQTIIRV